jgi:hypothetical protein
MCANTYNLVRKNSVYVSGFQHVGIALDFQISSPACVGSLVQRRNSLYTVAYLLTSSNQFQRFGIALDFQIFSPVRIGSLVQCRNSLYAVAYLLTSSNLIKSYLMGKIQDLSVSTYILGSLSVLTVAISI